MIEDPAPTGRKPGLGPRGLALIGLLAWIAGFVVALLPAIVGSGGFAGAYVTLISSISVTILVVILGALGAGVALLTKRLAGIALMLGPALFLVGYVAGYFLMLNRLYYG